MSTTSRKPTLQLTIGLALALMVLVTAAVLLVVFGVSAKTTTLRVSQDVVGKAADVAVAEVEGYLLPIETVYRSMVEASAAGLVDLDDGSARERYFFATMKVHPGVAMLNHADGHGRFMMVKRMPDGSLHTKEVQRGPEGRRVQWSRRPPDASSVDMGVERVVDPDDAYDPRSRPWYVGALQAEGLHWTEPYVFWTDRSTGVSASFRLGGPESEPSIFAIDISFAELSDFLAELSVSPRGLAVAFDDQGRILASPGGADLLVQETEEQATLRPGPESATPAIAAVASTSELTESLASGVGRPIHFEVDGEPWIGVARPLSVVQGTAWAVVVIAPESDFLGTITRSNYQALGISGLLVGLAVLASWFVSRRIAGSLKVLVRQSHRIEGLDFERPEVVASPFHEVAEVLSAFERMRTGLRSFRKYMPSTVVLRLLDAKEEARLGSEMRDITLFFSDVAGFTAISERLSPEEMAVLLGEYLGALTRVIEAHGGTVVQYVGDAIMAFWGAPEPDDDHAVHAAEAALACHAEALRLRGGAEPVFRTRFGVHTAQVAVGHFGSPDRLYYGAIGDGVNACARIESANKQYKTSIAISEVTWRRIQGQFEGRRLDIVRMKGKQRPLSMVELLGPKGQVERSILIAAGIYEEGFGLYLERRWADAADRFRAVLTHLPDDGAAAVLADRCAEYLEHPPPEDWDGIYVMRTK